AGVNAGFLDVLHDSGDIDVVAVAQGVDIDLDGFRQIGVEQQRVLAEQRVDLAGLVVGVLLLDVFRNEAGNGVEQVGLQHALVEDDLHGAATQNIGRTHDQREAKLGCNGAGLLNGEGDALLRLLQVELLEKLLDAVAVFGQVDHVWRGAEDRDTGFFERFGKLEWGLAAKLDDHAMQFAGRLLGAQNF